MQLAFASYVYARPISRPKVGATTNRRFSQVNTGHVRHTDSQIIKRNVMWEPDGGASTNGFADDKYLHNMEDNIMDGIDQRIDQDHKLNAQRDIIRQSLDAIVNDRWQCAMSV